MACITARPRTSTAIRFAFSLEDEGLSLAFHPRHIPIVQALPVVLCRSINVLEETADGFIVRELKLEPVKGE